MSETNLSAKALPKYPPIRENTELLTVAKLFGAGPKKWTKGTAYRDDLGNAITIIESNYTPASFDILGAIDFVYRNDADNQTARIRLGIELKTSATRWNDSPHTSYEDVMALVRRCNI